MLEAIRARAHRAKQPAMEHIVHPTIERYARELLGGAHAVVLEMEARAAREEFPIVGRHVGRALELLARSMRAERVFEMGSGFGYSAYFFARAVGERGEVTLTDGSANRCAEARAYLSRADVECAVEVVTGDALEILSGRDGPFDVIFCDVDKEDYARVPALAIPRLRAGGLLIVDNALWRGQVAESAGDAATRSVRAMNDELHRRPDVLTTILPIRDGVSVSLKL